MTRSVKYNSRSVKNSFFPMDKTSNGFADGFQRYFLISVLIILILLLITFLSPFGVDLLFAGVIVTAVHPVHKKILKKIQFSRTLASFLSMLLIIIVILIPFTFFGFFAVGQASDAYTVVSTKINTIVATHDVSTASNVIKLVPFSDKLQRVFTYLPISTTDLFTTAKEAVGIISSFLLSKTTYILKHLSLLLLHILVFLLALFYFLKDGDKLVLYIRSLLPLSKIYRQELFTKLTNLSYGIIYGIFGAALLQGFLVGVGFAIAGIGSAAFWGSISALFSPIPYLGTMVITVPAIIILAYEGHYIAFTFLLIWSALVVGTADNIIKPFIISSSARLHPLATLMVLLGGGFVFGLSGLFFGPLVLTLTLAFMHIYKLEYKAVLEKEEKDLLEEMITKKPRSK